MAKIDSKTVAPVKATTETQSNLDNQVLERLEAMEKKTEFLEKENQKLKDEQLHPMKKAKETYDGPRKYSYAMWAGVPVLNYTSERKDKSKDLLYKTPAGVYVSNHYLKLELANGKKVSVEVNEFNGSKTKSELSDCKVIYEGKNIVGYEFDTEEDGKFVVLPSMING